MMKTKIALMLSLGGLAILPANAEDATYSLDDLKASNIARIQKAQSVGKISDLRAEAIKDIAFQIGTSAGLAAQYKIYEEAYKNRSAELDRKYDFEALKLSPGVLPPVLSEGFSNYEHKSEDMVEVSGMNFRIERKARMVSVYPTWRDYLLLQFKPATLPSQNFMPKTAAEKRLWDATVKLGWEDGVRQAKTIWESAHGELDRDYEGMILYKQLLANKQITPTVVASADLGVTGDGTSMSVDHKVITITDHSQFQTDRSKWRTRNPATYKDDQNRKY